MKFELHLSPDQESRFSFFGCSALNLVLILLSVFILSIAKKFTTCPIDRLSYLQSLAWFLSKRISLVISFSSFFLSFNLGPPLAHTLFNRPVL